MTTSTIAPAIHIRMASGGAIAGTGMFSLAPMATAEDFQNDPKKCKNSGREGICDLMSYATTG